MITRDDVAVIIPSYNEKGNIETLIKKIVKKFPNFDVFIVDDNSPDGTQHLVRTLIRKYPKIHLFVRNSKSGRGDAVVEGFKMALVNSNNKYFIEMDADLSHDPEEVDRLLNKAKDNTIVIGSRYVEGSRIINWPLYRRFLSSLANFYIRVILGVPINDFTNGFRCYPRSAINFILAENINHKGFIALSETAYKLFKRKFKFVEVPIIFRDREKGKSNATIPEILSSLLAVLQIRFMK